MNDTLVLLPILIPLTGAPVALLLRAQPRWQAGWALGVMMTPALVVDGEVKVVGKVPAREDIDADAPRQWRAGFAAEEQFRCAALAA